MGTYYTHFRSGRTGRKWVVKVEAADRMSAIMAARETFDKSVRNRVYCVKIEEV